MLTSDGLRVEEDGGRDYYQSTRNVYGLLGVKLTSGSNGDSSNTGSDERLGGGDLSGGREGPDYR